MRYLMLVRVDPELAATTEIEDVDPWGQEGEDRGMWLDGGPLEEPSTATTVRVRDDVVLLSDGPFAETKEGVVEYDLLEAPDLGTAVEYASRHPLAVAGALEVREVRDGPDDAQDAAEVAVRQGGVDYLLLHVPDPAALAEAGPDLPGPAARLRDVVQRGVTQGGTRLRDADAATGAVARNRGGEVRITPGPFAGPGEQIAGVDRIRAADLDEALAIAAAHPTARTGAIEVRPMGSL